MCEDGGTFECERNVRAGTSFFLSVIVCWLQVVVVCSLFVAKR